MMIAQTGHGKFHMKATMVRYDITFLIMSEKREKSEWIQLFISRYGTVSLEQKNYWYGTGTVWHHLTT